MSVTTLLKGTGIPNFAQGSLAVIAAYVTWWAVSLRHIPVLLAVVLAVACSGAVAYVVDRIALRRLLGAPIMSLVVFTLGLAITINNAVQLIWGPDIQQMPQSLLPRGFVRMGDLNVSYGTIFIFVVGSLGSWGLAVFFRRTTIGLAMRAVAQNRTWPSYLGVDVPAVLSYTWLLAGVVGGLAGIFLAYQAYLDPQIMETFLMPAFTAAAIGGFASIGGSFIGGLVLGVGQNLITAYVSASFTPSLAFFLLLLVLIARPQGLFGSSAGRRV